MRTNPAQKATARMQFIYTIYDEDSVYLAILDKGRVLGAASLEFTSDTLGIHGIHAVGGHGPLLYESVFTLAALLSKPTVQSDAVVSPSAKRVWRKFVERGMASEMTDGEFVWWEAPAQELVEADFRFVPFDEFPESALDFVAEAF